MNNYININLENITNEHLCCAISDTKHQHGVENKKTWLKERIKEGHIFRKLDVNGKVFIEYAPLDKAWVPVSGNEYLYIYCLWVAGSYKNKGYGSELLDYVINDAKMCNKNGVCVISSKTKKPFISDKKFFIKHGFKVVDSINDYELLAYNFNDNLPKINNNAKTLSINNQRLTIYYSNQCPYTKNCIEEIEECAKENNISVNIICIDTLNKAKNMPCIFNNWAIFKDGKFVSNTLLNKNSFLKLISK